MRLNQIDIDFSRSSIYRYLSRLNWLHVIAFVLCFALINAAGIRVMRLIQSEQTMLELIASEQNVVAKNRSVQHALLEQKKEQQLPKEKIHAINNAIDQLNFPWSDLLNSLEEIKTKEVALLQIEPNVTSNKIQLIAETRNVDEMFLFLQKLGRIAFFDTINLTKHEVNEQDPHRPIRFYFEVSWNAGENK